MDNFLRRAANVVMVLSLLPLLSAAWAAYRDSYYNDLLIIGGVPWAVLWMIGYMLDGRMPWQIVRKGE